MAVGTLVSLRSRLMHVPQVPLWSAFTCAKPNATTRAAEDTQTKKIEGKGEGVSVHGNEMHCVRTMRITTEVKLLAARCPVGRRIEVHVRIADRGGDQKSEGKNGLALCARLNPRVKTK